MKTIFAIALTLMIGCASITPEQQRVMIDVGLYVGMTIAQAIAAHGEPNMRYKARDIIKTEEYLVYDDRVLVFVNDKLERVDR